MQKFKFPMEYLRVTQGENDILSHAGSLAMDFGGKDTGADKLYCPCDMVVKRCRHNANGELYLESTLPVEFADGTTDYARLICLHDGVFNVVEGQVLKQGDYFYDEGGMGSGNPKAFATHVHLEGGKGKWKSCTQSPNSQGTYVIENQSHLYDLFILGDDVVKMTDPETGEVLDGGYPWKRESDFEKQPADDTGTVYGVDVNDHRSVDLMKKIKAFGKAEFVIFRATIGSVKEDTDFAQHLKDSGDMKKGFFSANYFNTVEDAIAEADYLVDTIERYGFTPQTVDLPLFCDWEGFSDRWNKEHGITVTPAQLREMTEAFCKRIMERGYKAGVYLNLDFWKNWYGNDFFENNPHLYIWYARPGLDKPDRDCYIWQYACNNGAEYGVNEDLDKNILMGEYIKAGQWFSTNKWYTVTADNCEFFNSADVNDVAGKLANGTTYEVVELSVTEIGGFKWAKIRMQGGEYFAAILEDRCELEDGPDINVGSNADKDTNVLCKECEKLKAEMEQMEKNHEAALIGCFETIDGYVRDVHQLEGQNIMLKEKLTVAEKTAEIARSQMEHDDFYIQQLKTEKLNLESDIDRLKTEMVAIEAEKGVLKETIISLQEQLEEAKKPQPQKKCLLERILDILFGGA